MADEKKAVAAKADKPVKKEASKKNKKPNIFVRFGRYCKEVKSEIRKVTWPTPKQVFRDTGTVLIIVLISATFIGVMDFIFKMLIGLAV